MYTLGTSTMYTLPHPDCTPYADNEPAQITSGKIFFWEIAYEKCCKVM